MTIRFYSEDIPNSIYLSCAVLCSLSHSLTYSPTLSLTLILCLCFFSLSFEPMLYLFSSLYLSYLKVYSSISLALDLVFKIAACWLHFQPFGFLCVPSCCHLSVHAAPISKESVWKQSNLQNVHRIWVGLHKFSVRREKGPLWLVNNFRLSCALPFSRKRWRRGQQGNDMLPQSIFSESA